MVDLSKEKFLKDIENSKKKFISKLGYNPIFFSYPFGEYSNEIKKYIRKISCSHLVNILE